MDLKAMIRNVADFPKPGIAYKDITPILSDGAALRYVVDCFADRYRGRIDAVAGIESRGFIVGAPVAYALGVGLAVIRKAGKLPYDTHSVSYELEYGADTLEIHTDAIHNGSRVVLLDDLLATGGTAQASLELLAKLGADVIECGFIVELSFLDGEDRLAPTPTHALLSFDD
jgi:adenine phosphoribosyltransferase